MNCRACEDLIDAAFDQRSLEFSAAAREHALTCDGCARRLAELDCVLTALECWRRHPPESDLTDRILAELRNDTATPAAPLVVLAPSEPTPASRSEGRALPVVVTVALVLLASVLVFLERPASNNRQVARITPEPSEIAIAASHADLSDVIAEAKSAWWGLARSTAERAQDLQVFVPDLTSTTEDAERPHYREDPASERLETPVPSELRRAFDLLFDAVNADESTG